MSFPFMGNNLGFFFWWGDGSTNREMTGGEECGGYVQGKHAPWGLFNLSTIIMQSPSL